jgi:hypothetical protein
LRFFIIGLIKLVFGCVDGDGDGDGDGGDGFGLAGCLLFA